MSEYRQINRTQTVRYYFNIRDQDGLICDEEGTELPDMEAAREEARLSARDFAIDDLRRDSPIGSRQIEIADERGTLMGAILVRDIVR